MSKDFYEYKTNSGLAKWNTELKERKKAGKVGQIQAVVVVPIEHIAEIQIGFELVNNAKALQLYSEIQHKVVMANKDLLFPLIAEEVKKLTAQADTTDTSRKDELKKSVLQKLEEKQVVKKALVSFIRNMKDKAGKDYNFSEQEILYAVPESHSNYIEEIATLDFSGL